MAWTNLFVGWAAILAGLVVGAVLGTFFHHEVWLGGYGSWRRRMLRLTHISLVGTGLLNVAFALSVEHLGLAAAPCVASVLLVVGAATMPLVCLLSAWRPVFRQVFFVPVGSLVVATADFLIRGFLQ
jgi:hypothetical protein